MRKTLEEKNLLEAFLIELNKKRGWKYRRCVGEIQII
jgi:hypothetical protein